MKRNWKLYLKRGNKNDDYKYDLTGKIDKYLTFDYWEIKVDARGKGQNHQNGTAIICPCQRGAAFPSRNVETAHSEDGSREVVSRFVMLTFNKLFTFFFLAIHAKKKKTQHCISLRVSALNACHYRWAESTYTNPAVTVHASFPSFPFVWYIMCFLFKIFTPYPVFLKSVDINISSIVKTNTNNLAYLLQF